MDFNEKKIIGIRILKEKYKLLITKKLQGFDYSDAR